MQGFFPSINQIELFCIYTDMGRVGFFNAFLMNCKIFLFSEYLGIASA